MSIYRLDIEFASPVCVNAFNSVDAPSSIGADRLFSWICLSWGTLFGASDLSKSIIEPFLEKKMPWVHSDLFPCKNESIFLSMPSWAGEENKASQTILIPLEELHLSNEEIIWLAKADARDAGLDEATDAALGGVQSGGEQNGGATNKNPRRGELEIGSLESGEVESGEIDSRAARRKAERGSEGFQHASRESNLESPVTTIMLSRVRKAENGTKSTSTRYEKSVHAAAIPARAAEMAKSVRLHFCSLFQFSLETPESKLVEKFAAIFNFLKDEGLGGMRAIGAGAVHKITFEKICPQSSAAEGTLVSDNLKSASEGKNSKYILLSTCCPDENMIDAIQSSKPGANNYQLRQSSGWIYDSEGRATNIKKPHTFAFPAGSTFAQKPTGMLLDLSTDKHPCYRYGIPLSVRI